MYSNYTQLYLHLVWATWNRLPLISDEVESRLYAAIAAKCRELQCQPLAVGGIADHVHVLVRIPTTITVADIAKGIKGSTSHLMTHDVTPDVAFKWQGSYGAFTVSKSGVERVVEYIQHQKTHHEARELIGDLEQCNES
jgi:putative transposase